MKKYSLTIFLMICITQILVAQLPVNGDFEVWINQGTYFDAENWDSPNADIEVLSQYVVEPDDVSPYSGSYNAYLETKDMGFFTVSAILTTGDYVSVPLQGSYIEGGVPFNERPVNLSFYYRCSPVVDDNCYVGVTLYKNGTVVADAVFADSGAVDTWTEVNLALNYYSSDTPDTMNIVISSSDYFYNGDYIDGGKVGSKLWIDGMKFEGNIGIENIISQRFQLYPNPASDKMFIDCPGQNISQIEILNTSGMVIQKIEELEADDKHIINVGELSAGLYFIKIGDGHSAWMKQFIIQ